MVGGQRDGGREREMVGEREREGGRGEIERWSKRGKGVSEAATMHFTSNWVVAPYLSSPGALGWVYLVR